ncbi:YceI family protein [Psychrobacter sp. M13]|uniref:YceI family protein n=1 Tax=Psychrobacter sp. M13 TaxID=3067275 RepID=UPI00273BAC15|nr:YceI family protein [Psychrobacter sp. M13]WLP95456.1 YceI family protein [Psychrobacter sp. M13]
MVRFFLRQYLTHFYKGLSLLLIIVSSTATSYAASYVIDSTQTNVRFALDNLKTSSTTGGFYNVKGQLQYDPSSKVGTISLIIPIKSLDTGNKAFNLKLTGPEFFDIQQFPLARFESSKWYFNNSKTSPQVTQVDGNLTLHGETHPISLRANKFECSLNPTVKKEVCGGAFTATIDRTKWNINKYILFGMTKNLTLNIQVEATKQ